ncbi:MAG: transcriptional repressor LexA, partial [Alphaproteobacteria bacterium]|nr:transcriptional repressor LexA [Alphaproteobacteria bacterium]
KEALSLKSKSGVHRLISGLTERGFINRLPNRARAIEVIRHLVDKTGAPIAAPTPKPMIPPPVTSNINLISIPLYGRIAAQSSAEVIRQQISNIEFPADQLTKGASHYALTVASDTMKDAGIIDGDIVIVERTDNVNNGTIVIALIDNKEITLKRFRHKDKADVVALEPANTDYQSQIFPPDRVKIQGKVTALIRKYI